MAFPELYVSRPGIALPETKVDNAGVIERVRAQFRGSEEEWRGIVRTIERVHRYHGPDGVLAQTWATGSMVLWVAVLLSAVLVLYYV